MSLAPPEALADMKAGEGPAKCPWSLKAVRDGTLDRSKDPHTHIQFNPQPPKIMQNILEHIGRTPMVKLNSIPQAEGVKCEVLAKCEFFNAGGSVKDRIGKRMIEDAEKQGRIKKGDVLIEPTSGNTGIGLALTAAIKGYRMIITLPEKMSREKVDVLKALGAEIIRTPTEAAFDSPESHIGVAKKLNNEIPNSHILDQYANPSNPLAHYDGTAEEILYQCDEKVDVIVMSAGTGGTLSGIARKLKERLPNVKVIGVDPHGSILALPESMNGNISSYAVEGIGYDFIPNVLDRALVDQWIKTSDKESFHMSRRLIKEEGLLCGGSAGATMYAAMQYAKTMKEGERMVVLLADGVRNYMSKFLTDSWMVERGFLEEKADENSNSEWWSSRSVADLKLSTPITVSPTVTCNECVEILNTSGYDQLPCVNKEGGIEGMVTLGNLTSQILSNRVKGTDPISNVLYRQFHKVSLSTNLGQLSKIFDKDHFALVVTSQKNYTGPNQVDEKTVVQSVVTRIDLLNYILANSPK